MLFCGWYYDYASCINGKSRAELPLPYEAICLPLNPMECGIFSRRYGLDHGVGHPLLLLYDVKAPHGQKSKKFKDLGYYLSNTLYRLFYIIIKYTICITI